MSFLEQLKIIITDHSAFIQDLRPEAFIFLIINKVNILHES